MSKDACPARRWFHSHRFEDVFDVEPVDPIKISVTEIMDEVSISDDEYQSSAVAKILKALAKKTYIHTICRHCGEIIQKQ